MSDRAAAGLRIWRNRTPSSRGDRAYAVYLVLMVGLVAVVPAVRALWLVLTSTDGIDALASPHASPIAMLVVSALWAGALLTGGVRGPALRAPFPTHVAGTADLPRALAFRGPLLGAGVLVTAATSTIAALVAAGLLAAGMTDVPGVALSALTGALVGVVAAVAWLAGQAVPRAAVPLAGLVLAVGVVAAVVPGAEPFLPPGWVALSLPSAASPPSAATTVALAALAAGLLASAPALADRLGLALLLDQAVRWESATAAATGMELAAAAGLYRGRPNAGRRLRIPLRRHRLITFVLRDAVGAARTPGRLCAAALALVAGGLLLVIAVAAGASGWPWGLLAGAVVFAGLGPLTDGVRHAADVAADLPLYGIGDAHLLAGHALFPVSVASALLAAAVLTCALVLGAPVVPPLLGALGLGILAVVTRIGSALKGPLPPALLTPIPTPVGDLGAAVRLAWAVDGILLAAAAGASVVLAPTAPILPVVAAAAVVSVAALRWRHRG